MVDVPPTPAAPSRPPSLPPIPRRTLFSLAARTVTASAIALALVSLAAGCSSPRRGEARRLLETMAKANRRLAIASRQFSDAIGATLGDRSRDEDLRAAYARVESTIDDLREEVAEWIVPKNEAAADLVAYYLVNLKKRETLLRKHGPEIVDILTGDDYSPNQKSAKIREIVETMNGEESVEIAALKQRQRTYAATVGIFSYE